MTLDIVGNMKYYTTHREMHSTEQSFTTLGTYVNQKVSNQHGNEDRRNRLVQVRKEGQPWRMLTGCISKADHGHLPPN